ncbi:MAG: hypothetical protein QNJ03_15165 [Dinoroseobacter sp.]|nr:hypothetical protein [Dinoroseobacter sp.]
MNPWAILTLILTAAFFAAPLLTEPFSGFRDDQLPIPQTNPPLQPAGYAFAIWGVIYTWLLVSALFGQFRRATDPAWDAVRKPLCLSLAAGVPWLAVATQNAIGAFVLIWAMAIPAIFAALRTPDTDRWWLAAPVALYAGWLTAASSVATATVAAGYGLGLDSLGWAWVGLLLALGVSLFVLSRKAPFFYALAVAWALIGVVAGSYGDAPFLAAAAALGATLVLVAGYTKGRLPT